VSDGMVLTNVRLSLAEHRAAKRRAVELGVPLAELLRQGLLLVLRDEGAGAPMAREEAPPYGSGLPAEPVLHERTAASDLSAGRKARLAVLARTAGALRGYDTWTRELGEMRVEPPRDTAWAGRTEEEPRGRSGRHSAPAGGGDLE